MKKSINNPIKVEKLRVLSRKEQLFFGLLALLGLASIFNYALWWFSASHLAVNSLGFLSSSFILFALLSFVIWHGLIQRMAIWFIIFSMRKPKHILPPRHKKVALLTCFVPGSEPYELLEKTIEAMVKVKYPHDTWVLDEGNDSYVKQLCEKYGAYHFSRKDIEKYNQPTGPFKAKTKAGNHNAWRDVHEKGYDFVAQMDMDHIPHENYLHRILGYFKDEKVAFVVAPQIYANQDNWISRGAAEQAHIFHGPIQQGFFKYDMPLFIGTNHAYRPKAIQEVGGYASTIVEDHLTGMRMYAKGWKGVYVPEIIADGEGPGNWIEYLNQQMRWSYGIFEILFKHTPSLIRKLTWPQRVNFLAAQTYYLTGMASMVGVSLTCIYLLFGISAANFNLLEWFYHALPPFLISFFIQYWSQRFYLDPKSESGHHLRGMLLALGALPIYALAFLYVVTGKKLQYLVTAKGQDIKNVTVPIRTFTPHILIVLVSVLSMVVSIVRDYNAIQLQFWGVFNIVLFSLIVLSSRKLTFAYRPNFTYSRAFQPKIAVVSIAIIAIVVTTILGNQYTQASSSELPVAFAEEKVVSESSKIYLGVIGSDVLKNSEKVERSIGKDVYILGKYQSWGDEDNNFDFDWAKEVDEKNRILMLTWEPWDPAVENKRAMQEKYQLKNIVNGNFDDYITRYAKDVKRWNKPVMIRFAHEMNGDWYPWSPVNKNTPEDYKNAWIHVYNVFEREGVKNVTWIWSPNEPFNDHNNEYSTNFDVFYPGDQYVDWVAFSGFNWGESGENTKWRTFREIVEPAYSLLTIYDKPVMISEMNSATAGGDKDEWITQMNQDIQDFPKIRAIVWYESTEKNLFEFNFNNTAFGNLF